MKNLLLLALISTSLVSLANNTTKLGKIEMDKNTAQSNQSEIVFSVVNNTNSLKDNSSNREDIIRKASIESTIRTKDMSLSNNSLK